MRNLEHNVNKLLLKTYEVSSIENASKVDAYLQCIARKGMTGLEDSGSCLDVGNTQMFYAIGREKQTLIQISTNQISSVEICRNEYNSNSEETESRNLSSCKIDDDEFKECILQKLRIASALFQVCCLFYRKS